MNLHKDSTNNTRTYFNYVFKHNWQHLIFYIILMLLAVVLPTVMNINEFNSRVFETALSRETRAETIVGNISGIVLIISSAVAIFAGMSAFSYINSKQAVGCFHSFPITRQTIYFTETAVKGIYYLFSLLFAVLLSYLMMEINLPLNTDMRAVFFKVLLLSILSFCLFYSIALFAAGLTGTGLLRFLMFGVTALLPIAVYALICASAYLGMPDVDINAYLDFEIIKWLCPLPFIWDMTDGILNEDASLLLSAILLLIPTVIFYSVGYVLHIKRKSETSGTSIIWKPVFIFIKYAVIFVCTLCGGAVFGSGLFTSTDGGIWYIFGAVCGLILSFFLTNVILYRSVRSMFKGLRGLGVMTAVMALVIAISVYDVLGINEYVYPAASTKSVSLTLNTVDVEYTEEEDLEVLIPMLSEYLEWKNSPSYDRYEWSAIVIQDLNPVNDATDADIAKYMNSYLEEYYHYYEDSEDFYPGETAAATAEGLSAQKAIKYPDNTKHTVRIDKEGYQMKWKQTPKFGIPSYKDVNITYIENNKELFEFIIASDEYAQAINLAENLPEDSVQEITVNLLGTRYEFYYGDLSAPLKREEVMELYRQFKEVYSYSNESRLTSPAVGRIRIWGENGYYTVPIYAENLDLINLFAEEMNLDYRFNTVDEVYAYMAEEAAAVFLLDAETGDILSLSEEDQAEIFRYIPYAGYSSGNIPGETDGTKYAVIIAREQLYDNGASDISTWEYMVRPGAEDAVSKFFR